mmetsp:Transcript_129070/g.413585  ORF Transcript_129070/g.413585 Transcript_129070/m.413585 type:complete len:421 (+) Transcript_129070:2731-3993(+)
MEHLVVRGGGRSLGFSALPVSIELPAGLSSRALHRVFAAATPHGIGPRLPRAFPSLPRPLPELEAPRLHIGAARTLLHRLPRIQLPAGLLPRLLLLLGRRHSGHELPLLPLDAPSLRPTLREDAEPVCVVALHEDDGAAAVVQHRLPALARFRGEAVAELHREEVQDAVPENGDPRHRHLEVEVAEAQGLHEHLQLRGQPEGLDEAVQTRQEAHGLHSARSRKQRLQTWRALEECAVDGLTCSLTRLPRRAKCLPSALCVVDNIGLQTELIQSGDLDVFVLIDDLHVVKLLALRGRRGELHPTGGDAVRELLGDGDGRGDASGQPGRVLVRQPGARGGARRLLRALRRPRPRRPGPILRGTCASGDFGHGRRTSSGLVGHKPGEHLSARPPGVRRYATRARTPRRGGPNGRKGASGSTFT